MDYRTSTPLLAVGDILQPDENVRWQAQPSPWRFAWREKTAFWTGIPFTAFSVFWTAAASGAIGLKAPKGGPWYFMVAWGLMFVGFGLSLLLTPLRAYYRGRRTVYAVTDRRVYIIELGRTRNVTTFGPDKLGRLMRIEQFDGSGDLIIERFVTRAHRGGSQTHDLGLFGIENVAGVEQLIREIAP